MGDFYEYGQHFPPRDVIHARVRSTGETALVLDRESGLLEAWIDGRLIAQSESQIEVSNAIHDYRDIRIANGIAVARREFPDLWPL